MNRNLIIFSMIVLAVATRLLPHPPNVAPITGIALFAAHRFNDKKLVFLLPLLCMVITDIFLGFHTIIPFVYLSIIAISTLGLYSKKISNGVVLKSSTIFFLVSNFGVWLLGYPNTIAGFISCYTLALPFFFNTIIGDLFFYHVLNISFIKIEKKYPALVS
tara:strand:+ start:197 stop:679 length:483 start_codon:yes stop_codon:yes gene_type:complete